MRSFTVKAQKKRRTVVPLAGATLLSACYQSGLEVDYSCQSGTCLQCLVKVSDPDALMPPTGRERARLDPERLAAGYRLACQARFSPQDLT